MFLYTGAYYLGLTNLSSQEACILNYLWPVMIVLFASLILKEPLGFRKILAILCSFAGVVILTAAVLGEAIHLHAVIALVFIVGGILVSARQSDEKSSPKEHPSRVQ